MVIQNSILKCLSFSFCSFEPEQIRGFGQTGCTWLKGSNLLQQQRCLETFRSGQVPGLTGQGLGWKSYFSPFCFQQRRLIISKAPNAYYPLYILFSSVVPQTSYVKLVDIWFLFNLIYPFLLILLQNLGSNILSDLVRFCYVQSPSLFSAVKILLSHCLIALLEMPKNVQ